MLGELEAVKFSSHCTPHEYLMRCAIRTELAACFVTMFRCMMLGSGLRNFAHANESDSITVYISFMQYSFTVYAIL